MPTLRTTSALILAAITLFALTSSGSALSAQIPVGVIPGAPAGSPPQAPDSSNFPYSSLFRDMPLDDTTGFTSIFDGKTLTGWDGDSTYWRVADGAIVGESTPATRVTRNTFLIWRGERLRNFELKVDFRIHGANSGIQYRSVEQPQVGRWVLYGYQADLDFVNGFTGNLHDEEGRNVMAPRGTVVRAVSDQTFKTIGRIADSVAMRGAVNVGNWNRYHIIAHGPLLLQLVNGQLMSVVMDDDVARRELEGVLGLQMHVGDPFKVEFKNVYYKRLTD